LWVAAFPIVLGGCAQLFGLANTSAPPDDALPPPPPGCGDGVIIDNEPCNGSNLGGATCASAVASGWIGTLSCTASCTLDTSMCAPPPTTWSALGSGSDWSMFDVSTLYAGAKGFTSSVFDGRYLYFVPNNNGAPDGLVVRYDPQGSLGASAQWTSFDVSTVDPNAKGFQGGAWDGRYLYLVPYDNGKYDGVTARYDTLASGGFSAGASWTTFDIATVNTSATGFSHAAFDGRYVYYTPYIDGSYDGVAARYDTHADGGFGSAASWATFDVSTVSSSAKGFLSSVFDGRYVYLVPYLNGTAFHGIVMRFDPMASGGFGSAASWSAFNMATIDSNAVGFGAGAFDGRYVYFAQQFGTLTGNSALVLQFDTQVSGGMTNTAAWASFDTSALPGTPRGYGGAVFDGRYVYFSPDTNGFTYTSVMSRYDTTTNAFGSASSWATFDASTLSAAAAGFNGIGFDGSAVYLVPHSNGAYQGLVVRFIAKTPAWLPRDWNADFQ
jgi:hypothetical protein